MNDETTVLPRVREATEAEKMAEARNRGITLGVVAMFVVVALCMVGVAIGAFLTRVLAL